MDNIYSRRFFVVLMLITLIMAIFFVISYSANSIEETSADLAYEYTLSITVTSSSTNIADNQTDLNKKWPVCAIKITFGGVSQMINGNTGSTTITSNSDANNIQIVLYYNSVYSCHFPLQGTGNIANNQTVQCSNNSGYPAYTNYTGSITYNASKTSKVLKSTPTVTAPTAKSGLTYTGSAQTLINAGTTSGGTMQYKVDSGSYSTSLPTATNAGTYTIYYKVVGNDEYYDVAEQSITSTIAKANISPTVSMGGWTYGSNATSPSVSGNLGNGAITYTYKASGSSSYSSTKPTNAGTHTVRAVIAQTSNYNGKTVESTYTVNKANATLTAPSAKTNLAYTGGAQALINTGSASGGQLQYKLDGGSYSTSIPAGTTPGTYKVYYKVVGDSNHNDIAEASINVSIAKATIQNVQVAQSGTLTYTGSSQIANVTTSQIAKGNQEVTYTYSQSQNGTYTTSVPSFLDVGNHTVYFKASALYHNDAQGSFVITINKAVLTITALDATISYGQEPHNNGVNYVGFLGDDTQEDLDGELEITINYNLYDNAGNYLIVPGGFTSDKYDITYINGTLSVNPIDLVVSIVSKSSIYGDEQVELGSVITSGEIVNGDENVYSLSCEVNKLSNAGKYNIVGIDNSDNYNVTFENSTNAYTVNPKPLTISAKNKTINYGDAPTNDGVLYSGFVNDEDESVLSGVLSFDYSYSQFGDIGNNYTITPSGYEVGNYNYIYVAGILEVVPKDISATIIQKTSEYGDQQVELEANIEGVVNNDSNIYSLSCEVGESTFIGSYDIIGECLNPNYNINFVNGNGAYTVTKKALTITADSAEKPFDNEKLTKDTYTHTELANGDAILYVTIVGEQLEVGQSYNTPTEAYIIKNDLDATNNYDITFEVGVLTVTKAELSVNVLQRGILRYNGTSQIPEVDVTDSYCGQEVTYTFAMTEEGVYGDMPSFKKAGEYVVYYKAIANNLNEVKGSFNVVVQKAALTISANSKTIIYGDEPANSGVEYVGFLGDDSIDVLTGTLVYEYDYSQYENVGEYHINICGYTSEKYDVIYECGILNVAPREIEVTISKVTSVYKDSIATLKYAITDGTILDGDENVFAITCPVNAKTHVGLYDVNCVILNSNYKVNVVNGKNAYEVIKRSIILNADEKTVKYGEELPLYTFSSNEELPEGVINELKSKLVLSSIAKNDIPGKYVISFDYKDGYTSDTIHEDYKVELKNSILTVLKNENKSAEEKILEESVEVIVKNSSISAMAVAEIKAPEQIKNEGISYNDIASSFVDRKSEVKTVYTVKLLKTEVIDGVETVTELDYDDVNQGDYVVKIPIPVELIGRDFKVLHIYDNSAEIIDSEEIKVEGGYAFVNASVLDDFAFISLKDNERMDHNSFCIGWSLFIFDCILILLLIVYIMFKQQKMIGLIGAIASGTMVVYGIVSLCLHLCVISIIAFVMTILVCAAFVALYLKSRKEYKEMKAN